MNSAQIRQSFLDFFASKQHQIVPSAPLLPGSPNLLFTNAGMNPFVPYFLGEREAPYRRVADTQKCIRAGGKHNDLDDVGLDTYHHTFFEMLGNWSFGDYFKREAIEWAWELLTQVWGFPRDRLYVTVYKPGNGDPAEFDAEAYGYWQAIFEREGMDPAVRIRFGGKKDNFWMMGETGPCGPCSEVHMDLTPAGDTAGELVNAGDPFCIEIWNLVFIQFNAEEDGSFRPLTAKHVDTGMGFERVAGIVATTRGFTDFSLPPSNYNADLFAPIFRAIEGMCTQRYGATLPADPRQPTADEQRDIAFRVLADHIRTLSCSIADGILPGNEGRNYVLRRILRRAILYGRRLALPPGFFARLVDPVIAVLGPVFPELVAQEAVIRKVIANEEAAFDRTIDRGIQMLERIIGSKPAAISGEVAFELYDTYGFPLDLTQIIAAEHGLAVDGTGFAAAMEQQRDRARAAQTRTVVRAVDQADLHARPTDFIGYEASNLDGVRATVLEVLSVGQAQVGIVLSASSFYAEMGGQVGDSGRLITDGGRPIEIVNTVKDAAGRFLHLTAGDRSPVSIGSEVIMQVDVARRRAIEAHHSATHILHWALRRVLGTHVRQAGSLVDPDHLRFDFAHFEALSPAQLAEIEGLVNERVLLNEPVQWSEIDFRQKPEDVIAFFGDKYGTTVRVVDIGGYSKELCGGTHVRATGAIGTVKIVEESAIAAGVRRIEAVAGAATLRWLSERLEVIGALSRHFSCRADQVAARVLDVEARLKQSEHDLKSARGNAAREQAAQLGSRFVNYKGLQVLAAVLDADSPQSLRALATQTFNAMHDGLLLVGAVIEGRVTIIAMASPAANAQGLLAGDIIREVAAQLGGKGGGKPDFAMGGGTDVAALPSVIANWSQAHGGI
jgi:alanyl-tRNA synthetase